jgi:hypothetical protein
LKGRSCFEAERGFVSPRPKGLPGTGCHRRFTQEQLDRSFKRSAFTFAQNFVANPAFAVNDESCRKTLDAAKLIADAFTAEQDWII